MVTIDIYIYVRPYIYIYIYVVLIQLKRVHFRSSYAKKSHIYIYIYIYIYVYASTQTTTLLVLITKVEHKLQEKDQPYHELRLSTNLHHFDLTFEYDRHASVLFHLLLAVENHRQLHKFVCRSIKDEKTKTVIENFVLFEDYSYESKEIEFFLRSYTFLFNLRMTFVLKPYLEVINFVHD